MSLTFLEILLTYSPKNGCPLFFTAFVPSSNQTAYCAGAQVTPQELEGKATAGGTPKKNKLNL